MNIRNIIIALGCTLAMSSLASCDDSKSYADLLNEENQYVNNYLVDQRVVGYLPADNKFETGPDAPFYRIDEDGNLYMQVIDPGTEGNMVKNDELIYFRFTRWNLKYYDNGQFSATTGAGNNTDMDYPNTYFRFDNYTLETSLQWGAGIQAPLKYLPVDCVVNIVVKSQYGITGEVSNVVPFLYHLRFYRPKV